MYKAINELDFGPGSTLSKTVHYFTAKNRCLADTFLQLDFLPRKLIIRE